MCGQSTTQQKNYKNGPVSKFTFEVISWRLLLKNYFCFVVVVVDGRVDKVAN